jgi:probable F420-dependent oxidoreductase
MGTPDLGPVGIALNVSADGSHLAEAAELERLGYAALWLPGGQIDRLDRIEAIIAATAKIPVGSAIIPVDRYPPEAVAGLYARVAGRFIVGLGGPQQPRPLRGLHAYLDRLDQAQPPVPAAARILAALGPRKLELAASRAAGAIPLLVTPAYTTWARGLLGRDRALIINQMVVLSTDAVRARAAARRPLEFLSGISGYQAGFARMGFTAADIGALSDRLVDELVAWGSAEAIGARVREHLAAGADQVVLTLLDHDGPPGRAQAVRQLAAVLLS